MKKIYILLDKSGSMTSMWGKAIDGINSYIENIEDGEVEVMAAAFDTTGYDVFRNCKVKSWRKVSYKEVRPSGGTPLLDASGRIMWNMLDSNAELAILVVVTDGHENSSSKFKADEIRNMTKYLTNEKNYDIVFLGANFDGINSVAQNNFGMTDMSRTIQAAPLNFESVMRNTAVGTSEYFASSVKAAAFYSEDEKEQAKK